jgi:hypothetical protein
MEESPQLLQRTGFWRLIIFCGLFFLFVFAFWNEISLTLSGLRIFLLTGLSCWDNSLSIPACVQLLAGIKLNAVMLRAIFIVVINVSVYFAVAVFSIYQAAQFALPVRTPEERWKAFSRMIRYMFGQHGPAIFVKEGLANTREDETEHVHPGVALVDLSSAIVLEQQKNPWAWQLQELQEEQIAAEEEEAGRPFNNIKKAVKKLNGETPPWVRVAGPGVVFTEWGEKIHSVVDLRKQIRTQLNVQSYTRDGIELNNIVFAVFSLSDSPDVISVGYVGGTTKEHLYGLTIDEDKARKTMVIKEKYPLDPEDAAEIHNYVEYGKTRDQQANKGSQPPHHGKTPYPFHEQRVFAAAYAQALMSDTVTPWYDLPQQVAVNLFRKELERYNFDELFKMDDPNAHPLSDFKRDFGRKARFQGILSYKLVKRAEDLEKTQDARKWNSAPFLDGEIGTIKDENGKTQPKKKWQASELTISSPREFYASKLLRDRGIKMIAVGFPEFRPASEIIQKKMIENWAARWDRDIQITLAQHDLTAMRAKNRARADTQREMTYTISNLFNSSPHSKEALALRIFQALEEAATNPLNAHDLNPREVLGMLQNLHKWLLSERKAFEHTNKSKHQTPDDDLHPSE